MAEGCRYDDAGPWDGGAHCAVGMLPGADALGDHLVSTYGGSAQGFNCRPNSGAPDRLSVHGTGRAVDYFPPDMVVGALVADELVERHEEWGVQMVIWDHRDWTCDDGWTPYGGPSPHTDHIHLELTIPAATNNTAETYEEGLSVADISKLIEAINDARKSNIAQHQKDREQQRRLAVAEKRVTAEAADEIVEAIDKLDD